MEEEKEDKRGDRLIFRNEMKEIDVTHFFSSVYFLVVKRICRCNMMMVGGEGERYNICYRSKCEKSVTCYDENYQSVFPPPPPPREMMEIDTSVLGVGGIG